ncbi:hypothetical protein [Prescottella equi]|uniref:hypothetical protein n=1 Tax=Rhodococcus hoagii TaxID=43767 RepID=UPI0007CD6CD0|nr:hypothetical protein [Prescottella equi]
MTLTADDCLAAAVKPYSDYLDAARAALNACITGRVPFSADTVHALIPPAAGQGGSNVIPALMGAAAKAGRMYRIDDVNSSRRSRHYSRNGLWIGGPNA